ncbi:tRNA-dihydrouridine synthase DusA1 [Clostridium sp. CAG:1193]|nr:tRNA-dihydrouridine synthase DusA1 [Clostridium sp. CAG:1193]
MFKIGNVEIKNNVVLAPMAGICNSAYRRIIKQMGAGLIYAEMVNDKAIVHENKKTIDMLYMTEEERPISQQIFGSDVDSFVASAKMVYEKMKPDIIDINMGCPVPKVAVSAEAGAALLKNPEKIKEIVSAVVKSVPIPVTVKIRSGWDKNSINAKEVAKICEQAGASAICVHGRTRTDRYLGHSDWNIIKEVKESVNIPVIGNGDIKTVYDAKRMIDETGCDAVMIGRSALGNPWIILDTVNYLTYGILPKEITKQEKIDMCIKHLNYLLEFKPEKVAVLEMRSHIAWYLKGVEGAREIKNELFKAQTKDEIINILNEFSKE